MPSNIYLVTVEGNYYALTGNKKDIKPYIFQFKADDTIKKQGFLSAFRNALSPKDGIKTTIQRMMMEKYPDYKRFRTHSVTEVVNLTQENKPVRELALMPRNQIVKFIDSRGLPIDTELYASVNELRQALKDYRDNPESFQKQQDKRRLTRGGEIAVMRALDRLNDPETAEKETKRKKKQLDALPIVEPDIPSDPTHTPNTIMNDDGFIEDNDAFRDPDGIPEFDDEDELDALIAGV